MQNSFWSIFSHKVNFAKLRVQIWNILQSFSTLRITLLSISFALDSKSSYHSYSTLHPVLNVRNWF